jgi:hypothetical protein
MNLADVKALLEQEPVRAFPEGVAEDPMSMDVYNTMEQEESIVEASARLKNLRWYLRLWVFLVEEQSWLFLFVLGTFGALVIIYRCFACA